MPDNSLAVKIQLREGRRDSYPGFTLFEFSP
jgi:hypothetical protein